MTKKIILQEDTNKDLKKLLGVNGGGGDPKKVEDAVNQIKGELDAAASGPQVNISQKTPTGKNVGAFGTIVLNPDQIPDASFSDGDTDRETVVDLDQDEQLPDLSTTGETPPTTGGEEAETPDSTVPTSKNITNITKKSAPGQKRRVSGTVDSTDEEHIRAIKQTIRMRGDYDVNCIDDIRDNMLDYAVLSGMWAFLLTGVHDIVVQMPRSLDKFMKRAADINRMMRDDMSLQPDERARNQAELRKKIKTIKEDLPKAQKFKIAYENFRVLARHNFSTPVGILAKATFNHVFNALASIIEFPFASVGINKQTIPRISRFTGIGQKAPEGKNVYDEVDAQGNKRYNRNWDIIDSALTVKKTAVGLGAVVGVLGLSSLKGDYDEWSDSLQRNYQGAGGKRREFMDQIELAKWTLDRTPPEKQQEIINQMFDKKGYTNTAGRVVNLSKASETYKYKKEELEKAYENASMLESGKNYVQVYFQQMMASVGIIDLGPEFLLPNYWAFSFNRDCLYSTALPIGIIAAFTGNAIVKSQRNKAMLGNPADDIMHTTRVNLLSTRQGYITETRIAIKSFFNEKGIAISDELVVELSQLVERRLIYADDVLDAKNLKEAESAIDLLAENVRRGFNEEFPLGTELHDVLVQYGKANTIPVQDLQNYLISVLSEQAKKAVKRIDDNINERVRISLEEASGRSAQADELRSGIELARRQFQAKGASLSKSSQRPASLRGNVAEESSDAADELIDLSVSSSRDRAILLPPDEVEIRSVLGDVDGEASTIDAILDSTAPPGTKRVTDDMIIDTSTIKSDDINALRQADDTVKDEVLSAAANASNIKLYHELIISNNALIDDLTAQFIKLRGAPAADDAASGAARTAARDQAIEYIEFLVRLEAELAGDGTLSVKQIFDKITIPEIAANVFNPIKYGGTSGLRNSIANSVREFAEEYLKKSLNQINTKRINAEFGIELDDVAITKLENIKQNIYVLARKEAVKNVALPKSLKPSEVADYFAKVPLTIGKIIVFSALFENIYRSKVGQFGMSYMPFADETCADLNSRIRNFELDARSRGISQKNDFGEQETLSFVECSIRKRFVLNSKMLTTSINTGADVTKFVTGVLSDLISDDEEASQNKKNRIRRKIDLKARNLQEKAKLAYWENSLINKFFDTYSKSIKPKAGLNSGIIYADEQFRDLKYLNANFIFSKEAAKMVADSLDSNDEGSKTLGDLQAQMQRTTLRSMRNVIFAAMKNFLITTHKYNNDERLLNAFSIAMGPHQDKEGQEARGIYNMEALIKSNNAESRRVVSELANQIRFIILTVLHTSDFEEKIYDRINSLLNRESKEFNKKLLGTAASQQATLVQRTAVNQVFGELSDFNNYTIPQGATRRDGQPEWDVKLRKDEDAKIDPDEIEISKMLTRISRLNNRVTKTIKDDYNREIEALKSDRKDALGDEVKESLKSLPVGRKYLSSIVKDMLLEMSYGKGYSPYPYHSDIGNEQEEAADFIQDWKDFELSLVRDESRKTAIDIAKILVKDLELFGDVVDLVGKNQSVATEILKKLKKNK